MKKFTRYFYVILAVFCFTNAGKVHAQCTIDSTQTLPGVYPDTIADAIANHPYSQDITFIMVTDTLGFTITNYQLAGLTGLPFGFTWQCNNFANGCNYDPTVNLYGCINISGTTLIPGPYVLDVTVIATVDVLGDQTINYQVPFNVLPDTVSNGGFSMLGATGCAPLTVTFINNLPGQLSYSWDFGNTVTDTTENPAPQTYSTPGDYVVTQTVVPAAPPQFFLTSITIDSIPDNYSNGFPFDNNLDPDLYFVISDTAGNTVYDSHPAVDDTYPPYTWTLPNIPLTDQIYTIQVFDLDSFLINLGDDDLGTVQFYGYDSSGTATDTLAGINGILSVSYNILEIPVLPIVSVDTVHVLVSPPVPNVTPSGTQTICDGDSVMLTSSSATGNQWYLGPSQLPGDTGQVLYATVAGVYSVVVMETSGCTAGSQADSIIVNPQPPKPTIFAVGDTIFCPLTGYNLQWYFNNTLIPGATGQFHVPLVSGDYSVEATDSNGCSLMSDPLLFQGVGIAESNLINLDLRPNPTSGMVNISFDPVNAGPFTLRITDITGRAVYTRNIFASGTQHLQVDLSGNPRGIYMLEIGKDNVTVKRKIIVAR